jgi:hypothetical protein
MFRLSVTGTFSGFKIPASGTVQYWTHLKTTNHIGQHAKDAQINEQIEKLAKLVP